MFAEMSHLWGSIAFEARFRGGVINPMSLVPVNLPQTMAKCNTEEEVKSEFAKAFKYKLDTRQRMDLYTSKILYEFKYSKNLELVENRATAVAQLIYYVRELKYGKSTLSIPPYLCVVDKNEAFIIETSSCKNIYDSEEKDFDWDRAPSTPCPNVVKAASSIKSVRDAHVHRLGIPEDFENFAKKIDKFRQEQIELDFSIFDKKKITESNFEAAYTLWSELFGPYVENGRKASEYFLLDIQKGKTQILEESQEVAFDLGNNTFIKKPLPVAKYKNFWTMYERTPDARAMHAIWQRVDRLSKENFRRFTGEFYTPVDFASKAIAYLTRVVGESWWEKGYRIWDMAAGTGNLEYEIPEDALPYCYISTLLDDDAKYIQNLFPEATAFQYDYLNDDVGMLFSNEIDFTNVGWKPKMPQKLFEDLKNPDLKWIIFINPPYVTSNVAQAKNEIKKDGVSATEVRRLMTEESLGESSRELFSQFLWRINKEFGTKQTILGMFSTLKYINSNNDQKLRDAFFKYEYKNGFCFPSKAFHGNKGEFPVGFLTWDLSVRIPLEDQKIELDVFDLNVEKIGTKEIPSSQREQFLSKWVDRPKTELIMPPFSNAITIPLDRKDVRDKVASNFLCSLMCAGNDYQHQNITYLLSGPSVSAGAYSVTPANFERSMVIHAVRLVKKANWLNDRDQWMQPKTDDLPAEFVSDCVVWSLYASSNQTASLGDVEYKGSIHSIKNNLFPLLRSEIEGWQISLSSLRSSMEVKDKDRFAALWLSSHELSPEASELNDCAKEVYKEFFLKSSGLPWPQLRIGQWDSGWYQVRRGLTEASEGREQLGLVTQAHKRLGVKIANQLASLGFTVGNEYMYADLDS